MIIADALTGGAIGGTVTAIVLALICIAVIVGGFFARYDGWIAIGGGAICFVVVLIAYVWSMWPFAYDYHHWVDKQGTVGAISKRLVSNGDKGMYEKFVLTIDGQPFGVDDTRASLLKVGDTVHLRCKKAYQFGISRESHGWDCRWSA